RWALRILSKFTMELLLLFSFALLAWCWRYLYVLCGRLGQPGRPVYFDRVAFSKSGRPPLSAAPCPSTESYAVMSSTVVLSTAIRRFVIGILVEGKEILYAPEAMHRRWYPCYQHLRDGYPGTGEAARRNTIVRCAAVHCVGLRDHRSLASHRQ